MYYYTITANWNTLLKLLEHNLFLKQNYNDKLILAILNHKKYRALKYFINLKNNFSSFDISILFSKKYSNASHWLKDRETEGLIKLIRRENNISYWELTQEGKKLKSLFKLLPSYNI